MNKQRDSYQSRRRGAVLVFVGVILPALLVLMGVCIDVGTLYVLDARLQTAADLASLSGAMDLPDDLTADATARDIIAQHDPQFMANYEAGDIEFGRWNPKERSFDLGATPYNGIRVKVRQTQQHFLMGLVGIESTLVEAKAIAFADVHRCLRCHGRALWWRKFLFTRLGADQRDCHGTRRSDRDRRRPLGRRQRTGEHPGQCRRDGKHA